MIIFNELNHDLSNFHNFQNDFMHLSTISTITYQFYLIKHNISVDKMMAYVCHQSTEMDICK